MWEFFSVLVCVACSTAFMPAAMQTVAASAGTAAPRPPPPPTIKRTRAPLPRHTRSYPPPLAHAAGMHAPISPVGAPPRYRSLMP